MQSVSGRSLLEIFSSRQAGQVIAARDHVLVGKERHDIGRPNQGGYPIRGIRSGDWLYLQNFETDRWPGGNPETGYLNCDGSLDLNILIRTMVKENDRVTFRAGSGIVADSDPVAELDETRAKAEGTILPQEEISQFDLLLQP